MSRRSSLSALSLAAATTSVRPITKEEKEKQNSKKSSSPSKGTAARRTATGDVDAVDGVLDAAALKMRKDAVRHHLDRTTGSSEWKEGGRFSMRRNIHN